MPYVDTRIGRMFYDQVGEGPAVLLWHSFLCDHTMWSAQVDALKDTYRLILIDGPGHGASATPPDTFVPEDCVPAALDVLDAAGVQRAAIGGISWGAVVAMHLALRAPERVSGLAIFNTSAEADSIFSRIQNRLLAEIAKRYGVLKVLEPHVLSSLFSPGFPSRNPNVCRTLLAGIRAADRTALYRVLTALMRRASILDDVQSIRVPTLVVTGTADRLNPPIHCERIAQRIPGARLESIQGCGHLSTLERPDEVSRLLREFLPIATESQTKVSTR